MTVAFRIGLLCATIGTSIYLGACTSTTTMTTTQTSTASPQHGRYLLLVGGCNDCHSPGFAESGGTLPEADWLQGSGVGFGGPWGTTYPGNLRLLANDLTAEQWVKRLRTPMRPPMPTPGVMAMSDQDLLSMYQFIRTLGPAGEAVPAYQPPGAKAMTPVIDMMPH